jgi:tetratricopeptide (TPR) repeat protein
MFLVSGRCPACFAKWGSSIYCPACGGLAEIFFERELPQQDEVDSSRLQSMIEAARKRLRSHPADGNAHYMLGINYVFLGLFPEGISEIEIATDIMPRQSTIRYEAAALAAKLGLFDDDLLREVELVLEAKPEFKEAQFLMGVILERRGDIGQAVRAWQTAYQLDHSYEPAESKLQDFAAAERQSLSIPAVLEQEEALQFNEEASRILELVTTEPESPPPLGETSMSILTRIMPNLASSIYQMHEEELDDYRQELLRREEAWQQLESDLVWLSDICLLSREARNEKTVKTEPSYPMI